MASGGATDNAIPVINLPPSQSGLLIDSKGRRGHETPYHFTSALSSGVACDSLTYKNLKWCQAIYAHSGESSAFMFDILQTEDPDTGLPTNFWYPGYENAADYLNTHYVIYHKPYQFYSEFDGKEDASGGPYQTPELGSYAQDVETALNTDIRLSTDNLIPANSDIETHFPEIQFYFRYSASQGFRLTADYVNYNGDRVPCPIRIWDCPSVQIAHRVHGFGMASTWNPLDINKGSITTAQQLYNNLSNANVAKYWLPAWIVNYALANNVESLIRNGGLPLANPNLGYSLLNNSDSTPTLIPLRNIQVFSPELTFNKKLQSFRNNGAVCQYGNNEMATFNLSLEYAMKMTTLVVGNDANVWSLREGYSPQQLTIIITDEDGNDLTASDCWSTFFMNGMWTLPSTINARTVFSPFASSADKLRSPLAMNYLLFGIPNITTPGIINLTSSWGDPTAIALKSTEVCHLLVSINA